MTVYAESSAVLAGLLRQPGGSEALAVLHRVFGYDAFRGEQAAIIEHVVAGGDAVVLMPTGGGKSLCYQIPSLVRPGTGIVVSPLIALMQDQVDALRALGVRAGFINSTQDFDERRVVEAEFLAGELDLLYLAPERLRLDATLDLLGRGKISVSLEDRAVQLLARVADEAGRDAFGPGERVVVVRVRDGVAEISEEEILR